MGRLLKYDQVKLAILNEIAQAQLKVGDRIPSVRQLLTRITCSMITLRKSLEMLEEEGMLIRCIGKGTFLQQTVKKTSRNGRILFINVNRKDELSFPPAGSREYLQFYFNNIGLEFQYLQVESFSNEILDSLENVLGIMLYGWLTEEFLRSMKALQIPMITVGNSCRFPGIPQVELDIEKAGILVTEKLIQSGAKSIFLLNSTPEYYMQGDISYGVRKAVEKHSHVRFLEERFTDGDTPDYMRELIKKYSNYDAWIFETGNYYTYLGSCRYFSLPQHPLIGIVGGVAEQDFTRRFLILPSPDTVAIHFRQSIFEKAAELLKEKIIHDTEIGSVKIAPELLDGSNMIYSKMEVCKEDFER